MPNFEEDNDTDQALLFEVSARNRYNEPLVSDDAGRLINCRWEEARSSLRDEQGNIVSFDAVAYVNEKIPVGTIVKRVGVPVEFPEDSGYKKVVRYEKVPSIRGDSVQRTIYMVRWTQTRPTEEGAS